MAIAIPEATTPKVSWEEETIKNQIMLEINKTTNVASNIEATEIAMANEAEAQPCCPKAKTAVIAVIDGEEKEITLARTIYSMDELKKNQEKLLEAVDCR